MMSIRFFGVRSRSRAPLVAAGRGGASIVAEAAITRASDGTLPNRREANQVSIAHLTDAPIGDQQIDVADHLGQGEEGLRDRDIPPELLRDLVRRSRAFLDQ